MNDINFHRGFFRFRFKVRQCTVLILQPRLISVMYDSVLNCCLLHKLRIGSGLLVIEFHADNILLHSPS